jgi:hypothetical protein
MKARTRRKSPFDFWIADQLVECYVRWREEKCAVRIAYQRWADSDRGEGRLCYAGYLAALDREEKAASVYAEQVDAVRVMLR